MPRTWRCASGLLLLCCMLPALAVTPVHRYYTGVIGGKYPVQLELSWEANSELTGCYRYESTEEPLSLLGKMLPGRKASLLEFHHPLSSAQLSKTGKFYGQFSADWRTFSGDWYGDTGKHPQAVTLSAVAAYVTMPSANAYVTGSYPVFFGSAPALQQLNVKIHAQMEQVYQRFLQQSAAAPNKPELRYRIAIAYYRPDLVNLLIDEQGETPDHQHSRVETSALYRLDAGGVHLLTLDDLFDPHTHYLEKLTQLATAGLWKQAGQRAAADRPPALTAEQLTTFTLSAKAITFVFAPGTVDAHRSTAVYLNIPFAQLTDCLNTHGALYDWLQTSAHLLVRDPVTGVAAVGARQLGSDAFVTRYQAKTKDASEVGTRSAYYVYSMLIYTHNHLQADMLPAERQGQWQQAEDLLDRLVRAHYDALAARDGFGTMQVDFRSVTVAEKEETLASVLANLQQPLTNHAARAEAVKALLDANTRWTALAHPAGKPEQPADYQHAIQALEQVLSELKTLLPSLPDAAAKHLAHYTRTYITLEE